MKQLPLKFETEALNKATMVKEVHDLDCLVCPHLKIKGGGGSKGRRGLIVRCHHPALCVPVRVELQFGKVPKWCPRSKAMMAVMGTTKWS